MVAPRKAKKKSATTRIIVAVGIALLLGLGLLVLLLSTKGSQSSMQNQVAALQKQIEEQNKKLEEQKQIDLLNKAKAQSEQNNNTAAAPQKTTVSIVVARRGISAGTRLSADMLETMEFPESSAPPNSQTFPQALVGRITSSDLASGEPVLDNKLIDKDTETLAIPPGHRAMTIPITNISGVSGFINPGARVDLISVMPKSSGADAKSSEMVSKVLLQNVKVLATTGAQTPTASTGKDKAAAGTGGATVTLAVPANQAIKLALAYNNGAGDVQVLLRGYTDEGAINKTEMDTKELISGVKPNQKKQIKLPEINLPKPPTEANYSAGASTDLNSILSNPGALPPPEMPAPQTKTHSIEIIQANSRQDVSFETEM